MTQMSKFQGKVEIQDASATNTAITLDGDDTKLVITDRVGKSSVTLSGAHKQLHIVNGAGKSLIMMDGNEVMLSLYDPIDPVFPGTIRLNGKTPSIHVGGYGKDGSMSIMDKSGRHVFRVNAGDGQIEIRDNDDEKSIVLDGKTGNISVNKGDIYLNNADCAEDFDTAGADEIESGTVLVIEGANKLVKSNRAYDKRVAGVVSGAGGLKPGIILNKKYSGKDRKPVALMGKVFCKVDADPSPIEIGDMLTTSSLAGYAMRASDPIKAFGAVIGKALDSLTQGQGLIPILVTLQ